MNNTSLKKNALYNVIRSLSSILFPFITFYYASRVVGTDNIGKVNYGASIVSYFALIAVFGVSAYAIRECAVVRDDRSKIEARVSELFSFSLCTTVISLVLLGGCVAVFKPLHPYSLLIFIQSLSIVFTTIGLDWVNVVYDDYKYITVRSILISLLNLVILFVFVKTPDDYYIYAFLTVLSTIVISLVNFIYIRRYVSLHIRIGRHLKRYVHELMPFFVNEVSIVVYVSSDTTLLGLMRGDHDVGLYAAAVKIYTIVKSIFIAIFSVTLPKLSNYARNDDKTGFTRILSGTVSVFIILAIPAVTGLILYAEPIIMFVCGEEYMDASLSLKLLAIALLFAVFGGILTRCINIPLGYEKTNSMATMIAAAENIILNIPLIAVWSLNGAALTTVFAEITVLIICMIKLKKSEPEMKICDIVNKRDIRDAIIGTIAIAVIYMVLDRIELGYIPMLITGIALSVVVYLVIMIIMHNATVIENVSLVVDKIRKRRN